MFEVHCFWMFYDVCRNRFVLISMDPRFGTEMKKTICNLRTNTMNQETKVLGLVHVSYITDDLPDERIRNGEIKEMYLPVVYSDIVSYFSI